MPFVSLTRLRIRSFRFLPQFAVHTTASLRQIRRSPGFLNGALLVDRHLTFWTLTAWNSEADMRAYIVSGSHKKAMPHLMHWCDEASIAHWTQADSTLPTWPEADHLLRTTGRPSKVHHPTPAHTNLAHAVPNPLTTGPIHPSTKTSS